MPNDTPEAAPAPTCARCGDALDDATSAALGVCPSCDLVTHLAHAALGEEGRARLVEAVRTAPAPDPAFVVYQQRARGEPATYVRFDGGPDAEREARNFATLQLLDADYLSAEALPASVPPPAWWTDARDPQDDEFPLGLVQAVADAMLTQFHRDRQLPALQAWPRIARAALRACRAEGWGDCT